MTTLRRVHAAAAIVNGLALAATLVGLPGAAIVLLAASSSLLIWSLERLRHHLVTEKRP